MNFPISMTPRQTPAKSLAWISPIIAIVLTIATGFVLFAALGQDPFTALKTFFISPLDSLRGWTEVGVKMTPLLLCAVGLVVCFKSNVWNIGAEGQLIAGAIAGGIAALACPAGAGGWYFIVVILASAAGGALWGAVTALLRHKFHANEILVSLMLVYVAQFLLAWAVQGPMRDPMGFGFPQTKLFDSAALMPIVFAGTRLHLGFILALLAALGKLRGALFLILGLPELHFRGRNLVALKDERPAAAVRENHVRNPRPERREDVAKAPIALCDLLDLLRAAIEGRQIPRFAPFFGIG